MLQKYKYDWLKDGEKSIGYLHFKKDGSFAKSYNNYGDGQWEVNDSTTLILKTENTEFTIKFDKYGEEGVLVIP